ncbi:MAG TPA: class A beta-lactamase [Ideonella sp.]|uniref:class A beta-lactamase n=1 Tax=Ideonella sp. TaxID=1929293 RepID=UPI002BB76C55|nr:class A beta-lactamase [Ideonella sp.]HSI50529.1 class A beta-lactamase [Ideonella sp.]
MKRRHCLQALALAATPLLASAKTSASATTGSVDTWASSRFQAIEKASGGQLGVFIQDTATGRSWAHRADERFLMCSTFKLLVSAHLLDRVARGAERLDRVVPFGKADLVGYSPVTEKALGRGGMALGELCQATMTYSDNTAANLILATYGGPAALTAWVRTLGDDVSRFDRTEPSLNVFDATGLLDTTTPRAAAVSLQAVTLGDALPPPQREQLVGWMRANTTGGRRLKAGLPPGWALGDKTGTSDESTNDIAVVWPAGGRAPVLVTAYIGRSHAADKVREQCLAQVAGMLPKLLG